MYKITADEYTALMRAAERVFMRELKKPAKRRRADVVEESLETMAFIRRRLDAPVSSCAKTASEHGTARVFTGRRVRLAVIAIIAAVVLLTVSFAAAEALGVLNIGRLHVKKSPGMLDISYYDPISPQDPELSPASAGIITEICCEQRVCYTLEELTEASGGCALYPSDACGFSFERAEVCLCDSLSASIVLCRGEDRVYICEEVFFEPTAPGSIAYSAHLFGSYGEPFEVCVAGFTCAASESENGAALILCTDSLYVQLHGSASLEELEAMLASMLK